MLRAVTPLLVPIVHFKMEESENAEEGVLISLSWGGLGGPLWGMLQCISMRLPPIR